MESVQVAEVLIRLVPESQAFLDLRVAVVGNADAGKSTLLGVLTSGELDDGRGTARLNLFRHLHEVTTGRTSSISLEIAGFDEDGNVPSLPPLLAALDCTRSSCVAGCELCGALCGGDLREVLQDRNLHRPRRPPEGPLLTRVQRF